MQVEIWSDVVCPWCAVGRAHFRQALAQFPHAAQVQVRWRSFELDPDAPRSSDGPYVQRLAAKYGTSVQGAQAMIDQMTARAAAVGLDVRFDRACPGNTFDAHRLLHLAADRGMQDTVKAAFFTGYLTEGEAIGEPGTLQRLATGAGLDEVEVKNVLAGDAYAGAVRADERQATAHGITGVPFFVLDGRLGVSGAQPPEVLRRALDQAFEDRPRLQVPVADDTGGCDDGSCAR